MVATQLHCPHCAAVQRAVQNDQVQRRYTRLRERMRSAMHAGAVPRIVDDGS